MQHTLLSQRVLSLILHLHLLIPAIRSTAIRPEEEKLRTELDQIEEEMRRGSVGRGKMNELWGVVGQLAALRQQGGGNNGMEGLEWRVVDQEGLERITWVSLCCGPSPPAQPGWPGTAMWVTEGQASM